MALKEDKFQLDELTAQLPNVEKIRPEMLVSLVTSEETVNNIRADLTNKIASNNIKLNKDDCEKFFDVSIDYGSKSVIWNNTDPDFIVKRSLLYFKRLRDNTKPRGIKSLRQAVFCFGFVPEEQLGTSDENIEFIDRVCNSASISFAPSETKTPDTTTQDTKEPDTKSKREQRLQKINEEIRTPSADGTRKLTEKFPDIDAIMNNPHANITKLCEQPTGTPDDLIAMPIDDLPDLPDLPDQPDLPVYHIFEPLTLDSILETPPLDFLTDNLIVRNTVNVFFAPAKTGKTYLCLYYAICMAKGIPFLGMENHLQRNVGYLNLDMFRGGFNDRVKQVIRGFDPNSTHEDIQNILSRLKIIDREAIRSALGNTPNFFTKDYLEDLKNFIITNDIEFLFIDTFSRIRAGSKENDNDHMGLVLQNAEEFFTPLNCGCLFIHHTGKDEQTIRGAQALIDNSEFVFGLRKVNKSNKHLQLYSDTPRYTDVFELDVYPVFQQITNEETGAKHAESYFLTTVNPENKNSDIVDFLKAHGNPYMSKKNLAKAVGGNYQDRLKEIDALYAQGVMERVKAGKGFNYKLKSV